MLHDCAHSFIELAHQVLPNLMAQLQKSMKEPIPARHILEQRASIPGVRGAYVWMLDGAPVYVGITNNLRQRLKGHLSDDPSRANLALRIAANNLGVSFSQAKRQESFEAAFALARKSLQGGAVAFIEIDNSLVLYLFEPYCAMELDTSQFNRFGTLQILSPRKSGSPSQSSRKTAST